MNANCDGIPNTGTHNEGDDNEGTKECSQDKSEDMKQKEEDLPPMD